MIVSFAVLNARPPRAQGRAERGIRRALRAGRGLPLRGELNVVWTTRRTLREMNRRFRRTDRFTDVIAFRHGVDGLSDPFPLGPRGATPFGDLYIAVDQARANAVRFGVGVEEELVRLAVHGTLHLLGYTDYVPARKAEMWAVQEPIVLSVMRRRSG